MDSYQQFTPTRPSTPLPPSSPPPAPPSPPHEAAASADPGGNHPALRPAASGGPAGPSSSSSTSPPPPPGGAGGSGSSDKFGHFTLPPVSDDWIVFRESFLFHFDPDKRQKLRDAGKVMFTQVLSGDACRLEEPWTHGRLRSLAWDLRFAVQLLEEVSREPLESHPEDRDENRLAREAAGWAEEIAGVARRIEAAVEAWGGWDDDG